MSSKGKPGTPKIRRSWIRNPAQQVVPNRKRPQREDARGEIEEGLEEYKEEMDLICKSCEWSGTEEELGTIAGTEDLCCPKCGDENF